MYFCIKDCKYKDKTMPKLPLSNIRTDYKKASLKIKDVTSDPFSQFNNWFEEVIHSKVEEPNAMTLATTVNGHPSARIVLLKGMDKKGFYFYTNYESHKGRELSKNPYVALVFFWKELERQVRIEGIVERATKEQSDTYFHSRPRGSQIGAWSSPQSREIPDRAFLEKRVAAMKNRFKKESLKRPDFWGGFCVNPQYVEFWQGRSSRLHDRIFYQKQQEKGTWHIGRLAP